MNVRNLILGGCIAVGSIGAAVGVAQRQPVDNVRAGRHPNIAAAQRLTTQAFEKITAAQQANEFDMDGHAQKAKELLDQTNHELAAAAATANRK